MNNLFSLSFPNCNAKIIKQDGTTFTISYHELVDHILLLRQVINHPEMTQQGDVLENFIKDYCEKMARQEMKFRHQQLELPWQIDWIWHVHRLHPLAYYNDCCKQLTDGEPVDQKIQKFPTNYNKQCDAVPSNPSTKCHVNFVPSIDLVQAVLRQRDFLNKFKKHVFYSCDLKKMDISLFLGLVQNYACFMKLARQNDIIVPTFNIDLIWHTHLRYPQHYRAFSTVVCGFVVDHDDAIEANVLSDALQKTADRWKETYKSNMIQNVDTKTSKASQYVTSSRMVRAPVLNKTYNGTSSTYISNGVNIGVSSCGGGNTLSCDGGNTSSCDGGNSSSCDGGNTSSCGGGNTSSCGGGTTSSCGGGCGGGCGGD
ncbi:unnamed protein product [Rotaria sordida]|uniref:Uncharacterized protein n=1 Tax=Rotaria sordida TaxID=392033 RepID=A0A815DNS6_9BILA|nr:unnamed protein product [Rotaria sordida]CAF3798225.1 unnamed protein product [Rotaria sordida]